MPNYSVIGAAFVPLTQAAIKKLRSSKLTGRQYDLLLFFWEQDKFGDRWVEFNPVEIMKSLGISKGCYYEAIAKLVKLGLLELRERAAQFRNPFGAKRQSEKSDSQSENLDLKSENLDLKSEFPDSQPLEPIPEATFTSPQTPSEPYRLSQKETACVEPQPIERESANAITREEPVEEDEPRGDLTPDLTGNLGDVLTQFKTQSFRRAAAVVVCDRLKEEQEEFWQWVAGKAAKLPDPVRSLDLWAAAQVRDGVMAGWWCEWIHAQESRARAIATAATSSTPEPAPEEEPPADRLTRLKAQWSVPNLRRMVMTLIAKNPDWGIELGDSGPQLAF